MSQTGFYGWIREGVRRAVLLGVSDAVEQLGAPSGDELSENLLTVLRDARTPTAISDRRNPAARSERKRLGRSLDQIVPQTPAVEGTA